MILYTIVPMEVIFASLEDSVESGYSEIMYLGERVEVSKTIEGDYMVNRLISTTLSAYLNTSLSPGTIIRRGNI